MTDAECVAFLRWALPRMRFRWGGFRRVRRQICRRVQRRIERLGLAGVEAYRARLERDPAEWSALERCCRVTISRFFRDHAVFEGLGRDVLPELARGALESGQRELRAWSAGCASGEEPFSLKLLWEWKVAPRVPQLRLSVVATDSDEELLERARRGVYGAASLRELPVERRDRAFERLDAEYRLRPEYREGIDFRLQDLRREMPQGPFRLVLCRNLAFIYFEPGLQREVLEHILERLVPGGALGIGSHDTLPEDAGIRLWPLRGNRCIYRREDG